MSSIQLSTVQIPLHRASWSFPSSYNLNSNPSSATPIPRAALGALEPSPYSNAALNSASLMDSTNLAVTIKADGDYTFSMAMRWQCSGQNSTIVSYFQNNNNPNHLIAYSLSPVWTGANLAGVCSPVSETVSCQAGDVITGYYQLRNYQNTNLNLQGVQFRFSQVTSSLQ